ncbi:MAG: mandelate racemase/muconate lactonizing enzyme family protein [Promethearchaeota archaeon]
MRVSNVETFCVQSGGHKAGMTGQKVWIFVKVDTDEGIYGWGEAYTQLDRYTTIVQHVHEMARYLVGRSPFNIKHFTTMIYNDFAGRRGSMDLYCALSGIEQALWDIIGKKLDTPVYNLLGGACRSKIRVYANGWYGDAATPEAYAERAVETVKRGFSALKFDPFPGPWRLYITREDEEKAIEVVRAIREAVGSRIDLLLEVHRRLAPMHAIRVAHNITQYNLYWYEEPVPAENIKALAEVRANIDIPVVTGEAIYTKRGFREILEQRAADIINPDVCNCGGILELKEIAAMAEPYYVAVSPHNYNSTTIGLASTIQVSACIPNFIITEYFVNFENIGNIISKDPIKIEKGYIKLPEKPGLGLELKEEILIDHKAIQQPKRDLRTYEQES